MTREVDKFTSRDYHDEFARILLASVSSVVNKISLEVES